MAQKIAKAILTGTGIAGLMSTAALIFNNDKTIASNERMHAESIQAQNESNHLECNKFELEKYKLGLPSKFDTSSVGDLKNIKLKEEMTKIDLSQTSLTNNNVLNSTNLSSSSQGQSVPSAKKWIESSFSTPKNADLLSNRKEIQSVEMTDSSYNINVPLEPNLFDLSTHNLIQSISYTFMCFSFIGLFAVICLGFNLIIQYYGNNNLSKLPKWCQPYFNIYIKYLMLSNMIFILWILFSQSIILLLCFYLFYKGP